MSSQKPVRFQNRKRLIEAYCPSCGMFLAASPLESVLLVMEKMHSCPPNTCDPDKASAFGRSRIIRYAVEKVS